MCATITATGYRTFTLDARTTAKSPSTIDWDVVGAEIGDNAHFLIKEINEQPRTIARALSGRIDERFSTAHLGGLNMSVREAREIKRVTAGGVSPDEAASAFARLWVSDDHWVAAERIMNRGT